MRLRCFPFGKPSHCESSQLPPPLTGPGPGLLNSCQPYCLIRRPIVAVSMSQDLHKMPVHWLPHYNEHLPEYSLWVLNSKVTFSEPGVQPPLGALVSDVWIVHNKLIHMITVFIGKLLWLARSWTGDIIFAVCFLLDCIMNGWDRNIWMHIMNLPCTHLLIVWSSHMWEHIWGVNSRPWAMVEH